MGAKLALLELIIAVLGITSVAMAPVTVGPPAAPQPHPPLLLQPPVLAEREFQETVVVVMAAPVAMFVLVMVQLENALCIAPAGVAAKHAQMITIRMTVHRLVP